MRNPRFYDPTKTRTPRLRSGNVFCSGAFLMTSSRRVPIFDGHNDVLLRLYRRGGSDAPKAFLEGEANGQLNLPMARQGGFAGGLFAIFIPSTDEAIGTNSNTLSQN